MGVVVLIHGWGGNGSRLKPAATGSAIKTLTVPAVNDHNAEAVAALCSDDAIWEDPAALHTLHGRRAVLQFHRDVMFPALPDTHIELIDGPYLSLDGTGVAARLRIKGTMTGPLTPPGFAPTNSPVSFETAEFSRFKEGRLAHHVVVLNMLDMARQIGAVPRDGTVGASIGLWLRHVAALGRVERCGF